MVTAACSIYGRTSSTRPVTVTPRSSASFLTAGVGVRPTMVRCASGSSARIAGSTSRQKYSIASSFGSQSIEPVNINRNG